MFCGVAAHRIAFELAFRPLLPGEVVRHLVCDNPPCVNPAHLAAGSRADNRADCVAKGRQAKGSDHGRAKLDELDVYDIWEALEEGYSTVQIARKVGVSPKLIRKIRDGKIWRHVTGGDIRVPS